MENWSSVVPGLWRARYVTPTNIPSNTFAIALTAGELAILSPPCGADGAFFAATDALGKVTALIAPNSGHDLGQASWQARYPSATFHAPEPAAKAIAKSKPNLRPGELLEALASRTPSGVRIAALPGTKSGSTVVAIDSGEQRVLLWDEPVSNSSTLIGPAVFRFVFWLTGSGPGLARNKVWWMVFCKDKLAFTQALLAEIDRCRPTTIIPMHGDPIEGDGIGRARALLAGGVS